MRVQISLTRGNILKTPRIWSNIYNKILIYINIFFGVGTPNSELAESLALEAIFGQIRGNSCMPALTSNFRFFNNTFEVSKKQC